MHIHVAVPDPDTCMKVMEGVLIELPILLALSSNSPFWRGEVTGLDSTRTAVFAGFPRSGLPPRFDSYDDYAEAVGWLEGTGAIVDYTRLWWDVRPAPAARHARGARDGRAVRPRVRDGADRLRPVARRRADRRDRAGQPADAVPPAARRREQVARRPLRPRRAADRPRDGPQGDDDGGAAREAPPAPARAVRQGSRLSRRAQGHRAHALVGHGRRPARCASTTRTATSSRSCARSAS